MIYDGEGHYSIDFDDFENKTKENNVKLFILCNPHNSVGRVWSKEELEKLGDICKKYNVLVFSDEIHFDFIWSEKHYIFQEIKAEFRKFTITATAPSKTFNLAGAQQSNIFIPNSELKNKFVREYNLWLDFNGTLIDAKTVDDLIVNKAKLWLDSGSVFGGAGAGFQRINVACPRSVLADAFDRIKRVLEQKLL